MTDIFFSDLFFDARKVGGEMMIPKRNGAKQRKKKTQNFETKKNPN